MAPEQLEGKPADARTDLWALGTVVYEMITGRRAFEGSSSASLVAAILEREPVSLATVQPLTPPSLERLVRRCLAKFPDDRWDSAHDVADELRWIAQAAAVPPSAVLGPAARAGAPGSSEVLSHSRSRAVSSAAFSAGARRKTWWITAPSCVRPWKSGRPRR